MKRPVIILLLLISTSGWAGYKMGEEKPIKAVPSAPLSKNLPPSSTKPIDETPILDYLAHKYGVDTAHLKYLRSLKNGYAELVPALVIAKQTQVEVGKILSLRTDGQSWKTIADTYAVGLKPLNKEVLHVLEPIRKTLPKNLINERPTVTRK